MEKKATLQLETLVCPTCMQKVAGAIKSVKGIEADSVKVLFNASKAKAKFDDTQTDAETIANAIQTVGYDVLKVNIK